MTEQPSRQSRYTVGPLVAAGLIFAFYAISSGVVLSWFPTRFPTAHLAQGIDFDSAYDSLLAWAGLSYSALAAALAIAGYAARRLLRTCGPLSAAFIVATLLGLLSVYLLYRFENDTIGTVKENICPDPSILCDGSDKTAVKALIEGRIRLRETSLFHGIDLLKFLLNAAFQVGAVYLLVAALVISARCAGTAGEPERFQRFCAAYDRLFLTASFLLTLIVLTDVLFLAYLSDVLPESALLAYERGLVIFFAMVASMVLGLTLLAARVIGHPGALPGLIRAQLQADGQASTGFLKGLTDLLKNPTVTTAVVTLAPLLTGSLGTLLNPTAAP